ncbi:MAG TPA: P1 family peptidase [Streptosporangiaceae bacterium]
MEQQPRRARDLGIAPGRYPPGQHNAITDVAGVRVGQVTLREGRDIRTGVTAVVPEPLTVAGGALPAGLFTGNGYGKLTGSTQLAELGVLETPIALTGTLSVFRVADALMTYALGLPGNEGLHSVNPVAAETNDGYLSDIRARPVTTGHVLAAIAAAGGGPVAQGAVGAGTGTGALGFKAGIGTASRVVELPGGESCTVGVLLQANFSGTLTVLGVPVDAAEALAGLPCDGPRDGSEPAGNSCVIVVAVDQPLDARQLTRVARRAVFGMGAAGADYAGGSGDYALAFATRAGVPVAEAALEPVFAAVREAVEEAVLNSVFMAVTTTGYQGHVRHACPHEFVVRACQRAGVLAG